MDWFKNTKTKDEANKLYRKLALIYHPDAGSEKDGELFIEINEQYKAHLKYLENPESRKTQKDPEKPKGKPKKEPKPQEVDVVEYEPRKPRFTPKQKKHLVKGAGLLFTVLADKFVDRIN